MEEYLVLGLALLITGAAAVASFIGYAIIWKPRRRRRLEKAHFRSKTR